MKIDSATLAQFPPTLELNVSEFKVAMGLSAMLALGADAAELKRQFWEEYDSRLQTAIEAGRKQFFAGTTWGHVQALRKKMNNAERIVAATQQLLAEAQHEYSRLLSEGDPTSLLPTLTQRQNEAEASRKARDHFDKELANAEENAGAELQRALVKALASLRDDAGNKYREGVAALVQGLDVQSIIQLGVCAKLDASLSYSGGAPAPIELTGHLSLPERGNDTSTEGAAAAETQPGSGEADVAEAAPA